MAISSRSSYSNARSCRVKAPFCRTNASPGLLMAISSVPGSSSQCRIGLSRWRSCGAASLTMGGPRHAQIVYVGKVQILCDEDRHVISLVLFQCRGNIDGRLQSGVGDVRTVRLERIEERSA